MSYFPAYPHDPIEEIGEDLFMVRGSMPLNKFMRICRNMAVVRHDGELSLINPIRLSPEGEAQLKALGSPKRIIRLGALHGVDDPYYVESMGLEMWAQPGSQAYPEPPIDVELVEGIEMPFPDSQLFVFDGTTQPESALLIKRGGGTLLTCDAIQHYGDYSNNTFLVRLILPFIGFPKRTVVGPIWLRRMTPEDKSLEIEFRRLLELDFDALLSAHGTLLKSGARQSVTQAVDDAYSG